MKTLGEKLKKLRNDLTQEELAAQLQVDRSTLASWETNRREPDIATLCRIADLFNVSLDWLVDHTPPSVYPTSACDPSNLSENKTEYLHQPSSWDDVISLAQKLRLDPDDVIAMLDLYAKIAQSKQ